MEDLIALLLQAFAFGARAHWKTTSYAEHVALGDFYEALPGFADSLVETYQGCDGKLLDIPQLDLPDGEPLKVLRTQLTKIRTYREQFDDEPEFQNKVDEIVSHFETALYKLRFLD